MNKHFDRHALLATAALAPNFDKSRTIVRILLDAGATHCQIVGGFVRDLLLGRTSKDIDIEVFGISYATVSQALGERYRVDLVGRSFGVVKIDNEIDVSLPRTESKRGVGHKGFDIEFDPEITPELAAARRAFTINAIALDINGTLIDPYGGEADLERGLIRATTPAFAEDPLRVMRGMQFAARFAFDVDPATVAMCRSLFAEYSTLSRERIWDEWSKWARHSKEPSRGLRFLQACGWLAAFPSLQEMVGTPQDPGWHPEGDVFEHTCYVCDAAACVADRNGLDPDQREILLFSALLHDVGKPTTTIRNKENRWAAPGHASAGGPLAYEFFEQLQGPQQLRDLVVPLVIEHMAHIANPTDQVPTDRQVRRLSTRLSPATMTQWEQLVEADASGRPPLPSRRPAQAWLESADRLNVASSQPAPLLLGRHVLAIGISPGPEVGDILKQAYEAQLDGHFNDANEACDWLRGNYSRRDDTL